MPESCGRKWFARNNQRMTTSEFENICDRFDASWQEGTPLAIEGLLEGSIEIDPSELLQSLMEIELEYRFGKGEEPKQEEYRVRFKQQRKIIARAFAAARKRLQMPSDEGAGRKADELSDEPDIGIESGLPNIGPFEIIEPIGQGGMGQVFLAEQKEPIHRQVALKIIKSEAPTKEILARFDAERQALAMMDHHNIAKVIDAGETADGRPYFAMELVQGIPITEFCDQNKLSPDERLELFAQTCRAIQHAHNKGIVHRDIKPSNVLVTLHDEKPTVKVIDFGLAKAVQGSNQLTDRTLSTQFGQVVGTLAYMSPEQAEMNSQDIDTRTDVYSLGVVFYELLTGSPPITREKLKSEAFDRILAIIREVEVPRPSSRLSESGDAITGISEQRRTSPKSLSLILKGDLDWIAVKALEKDRARRYDTPAALADDIQRYLNNEAIEARPPSFVYQLQKSFRKHRARFVVAGTILGLLIAGLVGTTTMWYRAASAEANAKQEMKRATAAREDAEQQRDRADNERDRADQEAENAVLSAKKAEEAAEKARETAASATFQLANARWDARRVKEAQRLLLEIPLPYRNNVEWNFSHRQFQGSYVTFYGHSNRVKSVSFSPDGTTVVSGCEDASIKVWDATNGKTVHTLKGHSGQVACVQFSPDGTKIASASRDATIKIWDSETGKLESTFEGHKDVVTSVAFSPDGSSIVSGGRDKTVRVWNVKSGEVIKVLKGHSGVVTRVSFCPKNIKIASASSDQTIRLWDAETLELIRELEGREFTIENFQFSPDGATLASASVDNTITLWDVDSGQETKTFIGHTDVVTSVAFSPDGSRIVSGSGDKTLKLWNLSTGFANMALKGHSGIVSSLAFSQDGSTLATVGMDNTVRLWDSDTGQVKKTLKRTDIKGSLNAVCLGSDGTKVVLGGTDRIVRIWNCQTGQVSTFAGHQGVINNVAFSPDGSTIASASADKTVRLWNVDSGRQKFQLQGRDRQMCVSFSPDGSKIVAGDWNGLIQIWNADSGEKIGDAISTGNSRIWSIAFTKDGKKMALGCADRKIKLFDTSQAGEFELLKIFKGHSSSVTSVSFHPEESRIVSSSYDGTLKLWDFDSGKELKSFGDQNEPVLCVSFSPDGSRIASAGYRGTIDLWEGSSRHEIKTLIGHSRFVSQATFSRDGKKIYSKAGNEKLVWSAESGEILADAIWQDVSLQNRHGRWLIIRSGDLILLVDTEFKNMPREKAFREFKAALKPWWHREMSAKAASHNDWYAAAFHAAWLLKLNSKSRSAYDSFRRSYAKLSPSLIKLVPSVVDEALELPKPLD